MKGGIGPGVGTAIGTSGKRATAVHNVITANYGSFGLTGEAAVLTRGRKLTAAQGSFTLTGEAAALSSSATGHTPPNLLLRDGSSYFLKRNGTDRITLRVGVFVLLLRNGIDHLLLGHS